MQLSQKWLAVIGFQLLLWIKVAFSATEVYYFDMTAQIVSGSNAYHQDGSNIARLYCQRNNPVHIGEDISQGCIIEDDGTDMCTPSDASYNIGLVSTSIYVFIQDLTSKQYLYGENKPKGNDYNRAFCAGIENGQIFFEINTRADIKFDYVETISTPMNYQLGWNMIGINSDATGSWAHIIMPDGSTDSTATVTHTNLQFIDANNYITGFGGRRTGNTAIQDSLMGIISEARINSDEVTLADLNALVSTACNAQCPICPASIAPTGQEYSNAHLFNWDFVQGTYSNPVPDLGPNGMDFTLLDDHTSYDPIYVDNQGLYFSGNYHMRTAGTWTQGDTESMTIEGWLRPMADPDGTILGFETAPGVKGFSFDITPTAYNIDFGTLQVSLPITYNAADVEDWHYFGISIYKLSPTQSRVCGVFGTGAETCTIVAATLNTDGMNAVVGNKFIGMIQNIEVLDYPKRDYQWSNSYQTAGGTPWNGVACSHGPSTTGQCISTCEKDEYGTACNLGYFPHCSSCFGASNTQCFECSNNYDYTYAAGTSCLSYCGSGIRDIPDGEGGDDGNTNDDDGGSSICQVEPGWTCYEPDPYLPSICTKPGAPSNYFGFQECADGNNANGDGCDSNCLIERGWACIDGNPNVPDTCTELGGDGINYGQHECDDGNNINGDGGDENCTVELPGPPMWLCSSGNEQAVDFCHEWCGDGFRHENPWLYNPRRNLFRLQEVTCDDGNLRSGEGCDGLCRIEEGFTCAGGNDTHPDVGGEEGGDRRHFYYDQCDDG